MIPDDVPGLDAERAFLVAGVVVLVGALALAAVGPSAGDRTTDIAFDAPVPAEFGFDAPAASTGSASVDGRTFDSVQAAVEAAESGDRVVLRGRFDERVNVTTPGVTLTSPPGEMALVDGAGEGDVLTVAARNVTIRRVWVRNSGYEPAQNDAGVWVDAPGVRVVDARVTGVTFGVWVDGVDDVVVANTTIVGRERVRPLSKRGNGIQLWRTSDTVVRNNRITDVRDGIYFSWASGTVARNNTMWDLRYGVHFMYSDDCRLVNNTAFDNDVGYALMVSQNLELVGNVAANNTGTSGHGIMVKSIDRTTIRNNTLIDNRKGLYVYNSLDNTLAGNLLLENDVGVHLTAGSVRERVYGNSFVHNDDAVEAVLGQQVAWNRSGRGNYWSSVTPVDVDGDGVSEVRYRPAGMVDSIVRSAPRVKTFAHSPAFRAIRLAESTVPVVEAPGVIDYHPLADAPHDWRRYYANDND